LKRKEFFLLLFLFAYMPACSQKEQLETDVKPMKHSKTMAEIDQSDEWKWMENDPLPLESLLKAKLT